MRWVGALVLTGGTVMAQPVDTRDDPAWLRYHHAFELLAQGDRDGARAEIAMLQQQHPDHPATRQAMLALSSSAPGTHDEPRRGPVAETPTNGARAELALFQAMHGIYAGIEVCLAAECEEAEPILGLALAGGIVGAAASLSIDDVRPGTRALANSGTVWGAFNAGMLLWATEVDLGPGIGLGLLAGQGAGLGIGIALDRKRPTAGQVALANSGGLWTLALTGLTLAAIQPDTNENTLPVILMVAGDAGIGVGAYLASRYPWVSRAQTFVLDAGGIVGGVAGGGLGVMLTGDFDDRSTYAAAAVGVAAGLGAAAYLTRNWRNDDAISMRTALAPAPGGGALVVSSLDW